MIRFAPNVATRAPSRRIQAVPGRSAPPAPRTEGALDVIVACQTLPAMVDPSVTGGCLCGGVRFELTEPARAAGYCHCTRCQRRSGTAASAQARIDGRTFRLLQGDELVKAWRHRDGGFEKCFCRECGAHLFSRNPDDHAQMSVRLGAFDGDPGVRPAWRCYLAYAADWEPVPDDGLERFEEGKPRS